MGHRVAADVEVDLDAIWLYVATESGNMDIATDLVESITDRFLLLAGFPYAGRAREEDFGAGSRSFAVGEYAIVYCLDGEDVLILRVVHGRRELEGLFGR